MDGDGLAAAPVTCEFCGTHFETRRGLSSHARLHLRQLGVNMSDSSGAPIELLYQLMQDRDGDLTKLELKEPSPDSPQPWTQKETFPSLKPYSKTSSSKAKNKGVTNVQAGSSVWTSSPGRPEGSRQMKPFWAPLDTDAPITLASDQEDEVHVCQMCGCWFESLKALSRHAASHLRELGVPQSSVRGNPVEFLNSVVENEDDPLHGSRETELLGASPLPQPSPKRSPEPTSSLMSPPHKRSRTPSDCKCILCGEEFGNRKGLASHARSHLRQMGLLYLVGQGTAINTMQELVHNGILKRTQPDASPSPQSPGHTSAPAPSPSKPAQAAVPRAPKAKKGFRLAVDPLQRKPKQEPADVDVSQAKEVVSDGLISPEDAAPANITTTEAHLPSASLADDQCPPTVLCDYCGQLFETRKALSCHARSHLRQLGLTWSINTSPLELLKEFMAQSEDGKPTWDAPAPDQTLDPQQASNSYSSPLNFSVRENSPAQSGAASGDKTCELCGFEFENRKALASHARAHLRQLGLSEWKSEGANSPIECLRDIMRRDPGKVAAVMRRYRMGDLFIKKSNKSATTSSSETDSSVIGCSDAPDLKSPRGGATSASRPQNLTLTTKIRFDQGARAQRAHPPKKAPVGDRSRKSSSQPPPRIGGIPAMLPKPPLTPLVKLVGKVYTLKCRFCERVFEGPLSVQEQWISHLQQHILTLGYKSSTSPAAAVAPALVNPVAV